MKSKIAFLFLFIGSAAVNSCSKHKNAPLLTTVSVTEQASLTAVANGVIYSEGDAPVTSHGFCWAKSSGATISDSKIEIDNVETTFSGTLTELQANTVYFVRAFAVNKYGTSYGNEIVLVTKAGAPLPAFSSAKVYFISENGLSATAALKVSAGMAPLLETGICWSLSGNTPTKDSSHATTTADTFGQYSITATGLQNGTSYSVRAYATNSTGTSYSDPISARTYFGTMTDVQNNVYKTVKIGNQIWTAENLRTTCFNNGTPIPYQPDAPGWYASSNKAAYCYYQNLTTNKDKYGLMYNFYAALNSSLNIAPPGWRVATMNDWQTLLSEIGSDNYEELRSTDTWYNSNSNTKETNASGFSAVGGGYRSNNGYDYAAGSYVVFWTATNYSAFYGYNVTVGSNNIAYISNDDKALGSYIRLVKIP